ncbi:MAG: adenylate/guanylate cyclase domain-containing protein, partial [Oscillospiraceae bacterium]
MTAPQVKRTLTAGLLAAIFAALPLFHVLRPVDNALADRLYQHEEALTGDVVLIGIDQRALETLGPFSSWGRGVLAQAIEMLNADPENCPAVIGIDTIFAGETDPEKDAALTAAAGRRGNVVLASAAQFGTEVEDDGDGFSLNSAAITALDEPFPALREVTEQGHINAMYDTDGILRHAILQLELPDGRTLPSFHYQLAARYAAQTGQTLSPPPTDEKFRWYLPYSALPGGFDDGFSVADLLAGDLPAPLFAGKIVLIGPYAAGLNDTVTTSIDHAAPMYGVEFQANAVTALLAGDFQREVSSVPQAILLFLMALFCLFWFRDRKILSATVSWLLLTGASVGGAWLCFSGGYVVSVLYFPLTVTVLYIGSVAGNYVRAALEKRRVTATFQRYVAPEIVREILREGSDSLSLGGKLTDIAVLFVDIRGFTTMSELLEPAQVVEILNRYLTLTSTCIFQNGGTLDKFVGDCTMAFW